MPGAAARGGLRPRRRHLRHLHPPPRGRRLRGQVDIRDTFLGGEDFDQRIVDWLVGVFHAETGIDLRGDRLALQRLKEAAEKAKCEVSRVESAEISLPFISADDSGARHLNTVLTRAKFEELVDDLIEKTRGPCEEALPTRRRP